MSSVFDCASYTGDRTINMPQDQSCILNGANGYPYQWKSSIYRLNTMIH